MEQPEKFGGIELNPTTFLFLDKKRNQRQALTFDDITLEDKPSQFIPNDIKLSTHVTRNFKLKGAGILSAAMDTVTESELALELAKMGGLGVIHRNLDAETQVQMVQRVRNQINYRGMIKDPVTFESGDTIDSVLKIIKTRGYSFTSFPIVDNTNKLVGLVTKNDLQFIGKDSINIKDIMTPKDKIVTCLEGTTIDDAKELMINTKVKQIPVINPDNELIGMYVWNDICDDQRKRELFSLDSEGHFLVAAAIGTGESEFERAKLLIEAGCKILVIDTSHGASLLVKQQLRYIKKYDNTVDVIVGNVASYESAAYLINDKDYRPDAIKVGIGPGSTCTTRMISGHGVPQLTAIYEVYRAVRDYGNDIPIIADGGIRNSGDMIKCFAVGASAIMLGNILAGTTESPGKLIIKDNKEYKTIRGMGSREAMETRSNMGSRMRYFNIDDTKFVPEGISGLVEHKGSVEKIINELSGGIKVGLAHSGCNNIIDFHRNSTFWVQSGFGMIESKPHDIKDIHG
jgi:IMP dehydrogenase